jgi:predicted GNAT family N-acyltransferase
MIEIVSFNISGSPDLAEQAHTIRQEVFVKEQHVDPEIEYDEYEGSAVHYLLYVDDEPVATARWRETSRGIKLERFATLKEYRNKGLGAVMLEDILEDIIPLGKEIYLHSQLKAIPFYERYGFVKEGKQFTEADIEHHTMRLKNDE